MNGFFKTHVCILCIQVCRTSQKEAKAHLPCQAPAVVHVSQPTAVSHITLSQAVVFGETPVNAVCPTCRVAVTTVISHEVSCMAYCLCGLWACCCECLQDVVHSCPICKKKMGKLERF
ncbi:hypothetical protein EB796_019612 [Bugula neritina]|uniref:LITAF domain-containing protein n=1 Tax=Bugula neritina TaxID=10212 RepID=A0A7J7J773_BUGNE|nr:hypothetical protein EB796_019612 [Bugula neritina]